MTIPEFNEYGILPGGFHLTTIKEINQRLGFSPMRHDLIEKGLKPVVQELSGMGIKFLYLGGSFVTKKISPKDIDGYIPVRMDSEVFDKIAQRQEEWLTFYRMDLYPAVVDIKGYGSEVYWQEWFGKTLEDSPRAKGIIQLLLKER